MNRTRRAIGRLGGSLCDCSNNCQQSIQSAETAQYYNFSQPHWRSSTWGASSGKSSLLVRDIHCCQGMDFAQNLFQRLKLNPAFEGSPFCSNQGGGAHSGRFKHTAASDNQLSRDFLVQLWVADGKRESSIRKRQQKMVWHQNYYHREVDLKQPPPSQSVSGILEPKSQIEARVAPLLARSNLLITRDIEWANLVLGFEQENRYAVVDVCYPQSPAGFIREQSNVIARQLLRTRRPFVANITDAMGNELFRVRRPFWWITSSIYAEIDGQVIGVVHRRWHLWRRIYDLYLGNRQFAIVDNPGFWHWTFTLKDVDGEVLAEIDRDWRGFGFEIFTDAGQYVVRFGSSDPSSKTGRACEIQELEVVRPLTLSERAVAVALAISLDNDYFSRHGGWGLPFVYVET